MDAALVAVVTYAVLSALWGAIFAFYLRSRRLVRADGYPPHRDRFARAGYDVAALLGARP